MAKPTMDNVAFRHLNLIGELLSAFAVIYDGSGNTSVDFGVFEGVMERLSHRGPDGKDIVFTGNIALGHWHFWTTPEEVGECQPLSLDGLPFKIVLDGRLDNRAEIISQLGLHPYESGKLSDASLILLSYSRWDTGCFERFVGEFAFVILNEQTNELVCVRDHLGERTLFYQIHKSSFVIASEPWAVLGAKYTAPVPNESTITHFLSLRFPEDGQTFFKDVYELLPAHTLTINSTGHITRRYWQPDPHRKTRYKTDEEYAQHFLALLEESIRCRLRSVTPVGVLMSGGLDSASVACLAARMLVPESLTTISNVYHELPDCDEREYINTVQAQWNTRSIQIPCDDAWIYKNWESWPRNPNQPEAMFFRLVAERDYKRAQDEGLSVLLTGEAGDLLYVAGQEWLMDFIREGRFWDALRGFNLEIRNRGLRYPFDAGHLRPLIRALLERIAPWFLKLRRQRVDYPVWLNRAVLEYLKKEKSWADPVLERHGALLGALVAHYYSHENANASRHNVELRHPYRDRRLVEYVISIPSYLLHYGGFYKHILRIAMQGILPEMIRTRRKATLLTSFLHRGFEREKNVVQSNLFEAQNPLWRQFVELNWLLKHSNTPLNMLEMSIIWLCVSFESWCRSFFEPINFL